MPNHKSAEKRDRQNKRRAAINRSNRSQMRTELKKLRVAISGGKKEDASKILPSIKKALFTITQAHAINHA
ncbi:MAG: hypothetical protein FD167_931 [bacterium]|nr:MAG: hypothetical protein FD167_931 [bacterium]